MLVLKIASAAYDMTKYSRRIVNRAAAGKLDLSKASDSLLTTLESSKEASSVLNRIPNKKNNLFDDFQMIFPATKEGKATKNIFKRIGNWCKEFVKNFKELRKLFKETKTADKAATKADRKSAFEELKSFTKNLKEEIKKITNKPEKQVKEVKADAPKAPEVTADAPQVKNKKGNSRTKTKAKNDGTPKTETK